MSNGEKIDRIEPADDAPLWQATLDQMEARRVEMAEKDATIAALKEQLAAAQPTSKQLIAQLSDYKEKWTPAEQQQFGAWLNANFPNESSQGIISLGSAWKEGRRALASQPAAPVQPAAVELRASADDFINADFFRALKACREGDSLAADVKLCEFVSKMMTDFATQAAPPVQQLGDVREGVAARILKDIIEDGYLSETNVGRYREALATTRPSAAHTDDIAVDRFAEAMKAKMAKARAKGRGGWEDKQECPVERLRTMLRDHISKGDPVDVGNFAMMLFNRCESTATTQEPDESISSNEFLGKLLAWINVRHDRTRDEAAYNAIIDHIHSWHKRAIQAAQPTEASSPDDQWIFDLAAEYELPGGGLFGKLSFDATGILNFARAIFAASSGALAVPEWISVKDRLPEDDCRAIVASWFYITGEQRVVSAHYSYGLRCFDERDVTHWMPLPAAPATPAQGQTK